jgi:cytochrome c-type biogenesis protein CcmH
LAQTHIELHQFKEAAAAFAKADVLQPLDANMLTIWADAYVVANDRKWDKTARDLVSRALVADPKHPKALSLAGSDAFERGDYKAAIANWKKAKGVAQPGSMEAKLADSNIEEATARLAGKRSAAVPNDKSQGR